MRLRREDDRLDMRFIYYYGDDIERAEQVHTPKKGLGPEDFLGAVIKVQFVPTENYPATFDPAKAVCITLTSATPVRIGNYGERVISAAGVVYNPKGDSNYCSVSFTHAEQTNGAVYDSFNVIEIPRDNA